MGNNNPLVSVIVPNYCHSMYLDERILSILNQTYNNFELIILTKFFFEIVIVSCCLTRYIISSTSLIASFRVNFSFMVDLKLRQGLQIPGFLRHIFCIPSKTEIT